MKERLIKVIKLNVVLVVIFLIYYFFHLYTNIYIPCIFHKITGLLCPGCGITRCIFSIIKGDFLKAFYYNQLVFCLFPVFIIFYILDIIFYVKDGYKLTDKISNKIYLGLLVVVILFGIFRNII